MARRKVAATTKERQPARDINRAERLRSAIAMRRQGHEWEKIAHECGIPGGKAGAYHLVNRALKREIREDVEDLRAWEDARLNELLTVYYPKALEGDGWSFDRVLRLMERRASLLGLDAPKAAAGGDGQPVQTIVQAVHPAWAAAFAPVAPVPVAADGTQAVTPVSQEGVAE